MAVTKLTNVIVPEVFNPYLIERTATLSALRTSGIMATVPGVTVPDGGVTVNMPFWEDLDGAGDVENLSDSNSLTLNNISASKDVAVVQALGKAWGSNDLAGAFAGDDPMKAIAELVAAYWARQEQKKLLSVLKGIFAATGPLATTHTLDISGLTGNLNLIKNDDLINAMALLGDSGHALTGILCHSAVMYDLAKKKLLDAKYSQLPADMKPEFQSFLGRQVIADDSCPVTSGVYTTYLFAKGAIGYAEGGAPVPTETDRDSLSGNDILINRKHLIIHPRGVKWSLTTGNPASTALETAANWTKVYTDKNIRIVRLIHKIGALS